MDIGRRLTQFRALRGVSQQELAKRVGMAASQLCRYERGRTRPGLDQVERLAEGLSVKVSDLFW